MLRFTAIRTDGMPELREACRVLRGKRISPGLGFDDIEEVARVDEHVGFLFDYTSIADRKLSYTCFSRRFIPLSGSRRLNAAKPKWVSAMWMRFIFVDFYLGVYGI